MFITYDLPQKPADASSSAATIPGAKEVKIPGQVVRWKVGEFHHPSGKHIYGVQIAFSEISEEDLEHELVELPENAQNVQVYLEKLPQKYEAALKRAA